MKELALRLSIAFLPLLAGLTDLSAATVEYPKTNPALSLNLPAGWRAKFKEDTLELEKTGSDLFFLIKPSKDATATEASVTANIPAFTKWAAESGMEKIEPSPVRWGKRGSIEGYEVDLHGEMGGKRALAKFWVGAPKPAMNFLMIVAGAGDTMETTRSERATVIDSLKVSGSTAPSSPAAARSATVEYPKVNPVFTLELPDGWQPKFSSDGALELKKTGSEIFVMIKPAKDVTADEASVKANVRSLTQWALDSGMEKTETGEVRLSRWRTGQSFIQ